MTVTIQTTPAMIICHGYAYRGQAGYFTGPLGDGQSAARWNVQRKRPIRAAASEPIDRGLAEHAFTLSVSRVFATEADATLYRLGMSALMPRGENDIAVAEGASTVTHKGAVLETLDIVQTGVELSITFIFATFGTE